MIRKVFLSVLAVSLLSALGFAVGPDKDEMKKATGIVKSVTMDSLTLTADGKDWDFVVTEDTTVLAKGGSTLTRQAKAEGDKTMITDFVQEGQQVTVEYHEKDGKLYATKVKFDQVRKRR